MQVMQAMRLALLLAVTASVVTAQPIPAWWVAARFEATGVAVERIPVRELDPTWVAASALREPDLPPAAPGERLADQDAALALEGDFDGDGVANKAVVGVYRSSNDTTGSFLLILRLDRSGAWVKAALFKNPGSHFSALTRRRGRLEWIFCLECDGECSVVAAGQRWVLKCAGEP